MGDKKLGSMENETFGKRIEGLRAKNGYTIDKVVDLLRDENGDCLISDSQSYNNYKTGKRQHKNFAALLTAFSRLYGVSVDYLLGLADSPTPQVQAIKDVTGLSDEAAQKLMIFHDEYPYVLKMVDAIICGTSDEDILYFFNLYRQILNDYRDSFAGISAEQMIIQAQHRQHFLADFYSFIREVVTKNLIKEFNADISLEQQERQYSIDHPDEYQDINSI